MGDLQESNRAIGLRGTRCNFWGHENRALTSQKFDSDRLSLHVFSIP